VRENILSGYSASRNQHISGCKGCRLLQQVSERPLSTRGAPPDRNRPVAEGRTYGNTN